MKAFLISCLLACLFWSAAAEAAGPVEKVFEVEIPRSGERTKPRVLRVEKDDLVRLRVTSAAAGEVHLHGYRLEAKLAAGKPHELAFKARATGRYQIEWHPADEPAEKSGHHHAPPVAILEVRPK
jgi:hypothetical protein